MDSNKSNLYLVGPGSTEVHKKILLTASSQGLHFHKLYTVSIYMLQHVLNFARTCATFIVTTSKNYCKYNRVGDFQQYNRHVVFNNVYLNSDSLVIFMK